MRFEQRFGITHPENYEGASSGLCLTYQVFMDYVFPVLADEIKGKSQEEAIQIISDYLNDYGNITGSKCKLHLEQLVFGSMKMRSSISY